MSEVYLKSSLKLLWHCGKGHEWGALLGNVRKGEWCPVCAGHANRLTLEEMQALARSRGGRCQSKEYVNSKTPLTWRCKKGHVWHARSSPVKMGTWCPWCLNRKPGARPPGTIEEMQTIARDRGGECVSTRYITARTSLRWRCGEGHCWNSIPDVVKRGVWCPVCYGSERSSLAEMQALARWNGGRCLSTRYVNDSAKLLWQCRKGHRWSAPANGIKAGNWCPVCAVLRKRGMKKPVYDIGHMQEAARTAGGKCLTRTYRGMQWPLTWQCGHGHKWRTRASVVWRGGWCPECDRLRRFRRPLLTANPKEGSTSKEDRALMKGRARRKPAPWRA